MLFDDTYKTIASVAEGQLRERGSKFIAFAFPVEQEEQVKRILQEVKKEHPQAAHHCYAFRLTPDTSIFRFSDDREPSGTAGRPILNAILSSGLTNILIIVVRYFGGTLLGVPGLISAYREAAATAISQSKVIEKTINEHFKITCPYPLLNEVYLLLRTTGAQITRQDTAEECYIYFEIRKNQALELEERFHKNHLLNTSSTLEPA